MGAKSGCFVFTGASLLLVMLSFLAILNHNWVMFLLFLLFGAAAGVTAIIWLIIGLKKQSGSSGTPSTLICGKCSNKSTDLWQWQDCKKCGNSLKDAKSIHENPTNWDICP